MHLGLKGTLSARVDNFDTHFAWKKNIKETIQLLNVYVR